MIGKSKSALIGAALGVTAMLAAPAKAQDFDFKGKQIKLLIGFGFGGTYGKYSRMFAEHLKNRAPAQGAFWRPIMRPRRCRRTV